MEPLIPLFWTSGDISSGFQNQSGQPYLHLAVVYMLHIAQDSLLVGSWAMCNMYTTANLLMASMAAKPISSTYLQSGIGEPLVELKSGTYRPAD